jgi:hypothetical protein
MIHKRPSVIATTAAGSGSKTIGYHYHILYLYKKKNLKYMVAKESWVMQQREVKTRITTTVYYLYSLRNRLLLFPLQLLLASYIFSKKKKRRRNS